jgi:hypothetical protein
MRRKSDAREVGSGRRPALPANDASTLAFEWMSFSGLLRLSGADDLLWPGATFWGALASADRSRVRDALDAAARARSPLSLTCRLDTRSGVRSYLLEGEVVAGEQALAPRVMGVLVEIPADAGAEAAEERALDGLVARLAGALGEPVEPERRAPLSGPEAEGAGA